MVKKTDKVKRILFSWLAGIMAVAVLLIAIFLFWWYGAFLPSWIEWKEAATDYEGGYVTLKDKRLTYYADVSQKRVLWSSEKDWFVQDLVIKDLDGDNVEELIALVWKHGSFGKYMPAWVKENDNRLEQHIFIYSFDKGRDTGIHALWMSSRLGSDITSIASGRGDRLIVNRKGKEPSMWKWQGFGLYSAQAPQDVSLRVCCAGDNLIHLSLLGNDLSEISLYDEIAPVIREADISVINLETILVDDIRKISDYPRFGTPLVVGEALAQAGFDVINLANNHVLDQGDYGLRTTTAFFKEKGIPCFGACAKSDYRDSVRGRMLLVEKSGVRIAFLGYTYGTNGIDLYGKYDYTFVSGHVPVQYVKCYYGGEHITPGLTALWHGNMVDIDGGCSYGEHFYDGNPEHQNGMLFLRLDDLKEFPVSF